MAEPQFFGGAFLNRWHQRLVLPQGEVAVESSLTFGRLLRNLLLLAVFGFVAVVFAKPVLTAVAVLLAFALIGFLLWLPLHTLVLGRHTATAQLRQWPGGVAAAVVRPEHGCRQVGQWNCHLLSKSWESGYRRGADAAGDWQRCVLGGLTFRAHEGSQQDRRPCRWAFWLVW